MTTRQRSAKPAGKTGGGPERLPAQLSQVNLNAGGIDVGATSHFVAVPADRAEPQVREFAGFTADLYRLAECGVETVVMESTGVYWIPPVRRAGRTGLPGDAGRPAAHQERVRPQDRRAGLPMAAGSCTPTDCCRAPFAPTRKYDVCAATCGSEPCWCSTRPITSSICRRR